MTDRALVRAARLAALLNEDGTVIPGPSGLLKEAQGPLEVSLWIGGGHRRQGQELALWVVCRALLSAERKTCVPRTAVWKFVPLRFRENQTALFAVGRG